MNLCIIVIIIICSFRLSRRKISGYLRKWRNLHRSCLTSCFTTEKFNRRDPLRTIFGTFKINLMIILFQNESLLKRSPDQSERSNWMKVDDRVRVNDPSENETANEVKWTVSDSHDWRVTLKILNPWMLCRESGKGYIHIETFILKIFADSKS